MTGNFEDNIVFFEVHVFKYILYDSYFGIDVMTMTI